MGPKEKHADGPDCDQSDYKNDQAIVWVGGGVMTSGFGPFSYLVIHNIQ